MKYIIIEVCCFDCKKFENVAICKDDEELRRFFSALLEDIKNGEKNTNYYVYTLEGDLIFSL